MIWKAILCLQHFCSFGAMLFIVNFVHFLELSCKSDYTVICVPCMLDHVCYEPFIFLKIADLEDTLC